jgi:exopolysaccharide production protein ExoZ
MQHKKQVGIQVARAIAALNIVYFHSWTAITRFPKDTAYLIPGLSNYGWFAVDLFLAISGYVICLVVSRGTFSPSSFLLKRAFRLYPLWLVTLTIFTAAAWSWRGLLPSETLGWFIYSATLLPTQGYPLYDIGWTLQHEIAFYLIAAVVIPLFQVRGLAVLLLASTIIYHTIDLPWYIANLACRHAEFLAGVLAFMAAGQLATFGFFIPATTGIFLLVIFSQIDYASLPIGLFFLIVAFANLETSENAWWRKPAVALADASYSIYHNIFVRIFDHQQTTFLAAVGRGAGSIWMHRHRN